MFSLSFVLLGQKSKYRLLGFLFSFFKGNSPKLTQILWEHLRGTHWGLDTEVRRNTQIQAYLQDVC